MRRERLKFSQRLTGGKLTTPELLKRVKSLHTELVKLEQETVQTSSLENVAKELIAQNVLLHRDKGVKAYTACCVADILRLYAPEAPYSADELKDIFHFFLRQIRYLQPPPDDPYFDQYFYLLESLSQVRSIYLICDLERGEELVADVVATLFDKVKEKELPKNVVAAMTDLITLVLEECASSMLGGRVLEVLIAQFLPENVKRSPTAFRMATDVCTPMADKLQRHVSQYFSEIISNATDPTLITPGEPSSDTISAHALIQSIASAVPSLLLNVLPQIEQELGHEDLGIRTLATKTLGDIWSGPHGLAATYVQTWKCWIGRHKDKERGIRTLTLEKIGEIWKRYPEMSRELAEVLKARLVDPEEKVRKVACTVLGEVEYETVKVAVEKEVLKTAAERVRDRKSSVVQEAAGTLGRMWFAAFADVEAGDVEATDKFGWIPNALLVSLGMEQETRNIVEQTILTYILPLPLSANEEVQWVDRLLQVVGFLDEEGVKALLVLTRLQDRKGPRPFAQFINACKEFNGGTMDANEEAVTAKLKAIISALSRTFPNPTQAAEDLNKFAKLNEQRLYQMLNTLMDPQSDLKTILKTKLECTRRLEPAGSNVVETFNIFIRRSSLLILNRSSVSTLLKRLQRHGSVINGNGVGGGSVEEHTAASAKRLLDYVAKFCPSIFKSHISDLVKALTIGTKEKEKATEGEEDTRRVVETVLHALSELGKEESEALTNDKRIFDKSVNIAMSDEPLQAKFAATIIATDVPRVSKCEALVKELTDSLDENGGKGLVAHLYALARIVKHAAGCFETKSDVITAFILKNLLMTKLDNEPQWDSDTDWVDDSELHDVAKARVVGLKVLVNRCISYAASEDAAQITAPILRLLWSLLDPKPAESKKIRHSAPVQSRLRLTAAIGLLKLAAVPQLEKLLMPQFLTLALVAQDPCFEVRFGFIEKLTKYLQLRRITRPQYNIILFLVAHDPEEDILNMAKLSLRRRMVNITTKMRAENFEFIFVRFLHLLAHHGDFSTDPQDLAGFAKYIEFYFTTVANGDNISFLFHLCSKIKTVADREGDPYSENLYVLAELAQHVARTLAKQHNWNMPSFPGSVKLPVDIFKPLPSKEHAQQIAKRNYLPDEIVKLIGPFGKPLKAEVKPKKIRTPKEPKERKGRERKEGRKVGTTRKRKRDRWEDEDDIGSPEGTSDEDEREEAGDEEAKPVSLTREQRSKRRQAKKDGEKMEVDEENHDGRSSPQTLSSPLSELDDLPSAPPVVKRRRAETPPSATTKSKTMGKEKAMSNSKDDSKEDSKSRKKRKAVATPIMTEGEEEETEKVHQVRKKVNGRRLEEKDEEGSRGKETRSRRAKRRKGTSEDEPMEED